MNRFRRATALALTLFLIQLVLVGSGFTCVPGRGDAGGAMADMGMAGMPTMAGMPADASNGAAADRTSPGAPSSDADSCNLPWAPSGCTLMIPCAPHAVIAQSQPIADRPSASHATVAREVVTPASAIIALDTPPPRA